MLIPLSYLFLFFLPHIHCSCLDHYICGDINITFPFIPNVTAQLSNANSTAADACKGNYSVQCADGSNPTIELEGRVFAVKNISYENKVLIVQDDILSNYFSAENCGFVGFLEFMTDPVDQFHLPNHSQVQNFSQSFPDCTDGHHGFFPNFIARPHESGNCIPHVLYDWNDELKEELHIAASGVNCVSHKPAMFEWVLSFSEDDSSLSLQSAGFSRKFELREDCFNCLAWFTEGKHCDSSSGPIDSACFCANGCSSKGRDWKLIVIGTVGGLVSFLLLFGSMAIYFARHARLFNSLIFSSKNSNTNQNIEAFLEEYGSLTLKRYSYSHVKEITKSFQQRLGQGGCGTVFKGTLSNGHMVAVKILNNPQGNGDDFINEVASIGRTYHVNIVRLLGFCSEGSKRALIYEFMCNGSLEQFLNLMRPKTAVDWEKLYQIAIGIARGLEYLHSGCKTRIIHFDIKPHNILLDEDFCPKISDFGLAKLCPQKESIISIAGARGTVGYIAPEVFSRIFGVVSSKSDVYSYGMMVLEMAEGKRNSEVRETNSSEMYFPHWIYEHLEQNRNILPFGMTTESAETTRKMMLVGLWCIQAMPGNRPSMSRVIEMLEGSVDDLQVPPKSYLSSAPFGLLATSSIQDVCSPDSSFSVQP